MSKVTSKKMAFLFLSACILTSNAYGMSYLHSIYSIFTGTDTNTERFEKACAALNEYYGTLDQFDPKKTETALEKIKESRKNFSIWDRWGYSIKPSDAATLRQLNDDFTLLNNYYVTRDCAYTNHKIPSRVNPNDPTDQQIPNIIKRTLGYGRYVDANEVQSELFEAAKENDATKLSTAIQRLRQVRKQFSFSEMLGETPKVMCIGDHFDRELLFNNAGLTYEIYSRIADGSKDVKKCEEAINAVQQEFDIKREATRDSNTEYNFYLRGRPVFLNALYNTHAFLNSKKLLEDARKHNNEEAVKVILDKNPQLKTK
jgi:hypothetical protein